MEKILNCIYDCENLKQVDKVVKSARIIPISSNAYC